MDKYFRIRSECWRWSGGTSGSHCQRFPGSDQLGLLIVGGHVLLHACRRYGVAGSTYSRGSTISAGNFPRHRAKARPAWVRKT